MMDRQLALCGLTQKVGWDSQKNNSRPGGVAYLWSDRAVLSQVHSGMHCLINLGLQGLSLAGPDNYEVW
jgi:hypothetical protein